MRPAIAGGPRNRLTMLSETRYEALVSPSLNYIRLGSKIDTKLDPEAFLLSPLKKIEQYASPTISGVTKTRSVRLCRPVATDLS